MALRIGGLPVLMGPADLIAGVTAVAGWTGATVELISGLPVRTAALLGELELLLVRVTRVAGQAEILLGRADGIVDAIAEVLAAANLSVAGVEAVLAKADVITTGAGRIVADAGGVTGAASDVVVIAAAVTEEARAVVGHASGAADEAAALLAIYEPIAEAAAPLARRFVEEFSTDELTAAIRMVDQLPQLAEHLESDIMPILAQLDHVGPDITELLRVVKDVRRAIETVPGYRLLRRRGEDGEDRR